jgi:hypothetical protein
MNMDLVDNNGQKLNAEPKKIVDVQGEELSSTPPKQMSTKDVGLALCNHMLTKAQAFPTNDLINKQFDVLFHMALNILAHRIVNVGLGMEAGNTIAEWDTSRAFAYRKEVEEGLETTVDEWKTQFFNGELYFNAGKPT